MRSMINIEESRTQRENTLATMSVLYPVAFAVVTASNSRSGQALQVWEADDARDQRSHTEKFLQMPLTAPVGIHPIVKNVSTI